MTDSFVTRFSDYQPSGRRVDGKKVAVGVDIDGCVDPGMYKHETGFALASIFHYKLQMITPIAMRAWMFENCYSQDRGITRFVALYRWIELLQQTPSVQEAGVALPKFKFLRRWAEVTKSLSPEALEKYLAQGNFVEIVTEDESVEDALDELRDVAAWSRLVNELAVPASRNLKPFPGAVRSLRALHEQGVDLCAVSGTPEAHVIGQLKEYGLIDLFRGIFAQEAGKKNLALKAMMVSDMGESEQPLLHASAPRYDVIAMIGDAPQDFNETKKANETLTGREDAPVRMYLLEVGRENESWQYFHDQVMGKLLAGAWPEADEHSLIEKGLDNLDRVWDPNLAPIDTYPKRSQSV